MLKKDCFYLGKVAKKFSFKGEVLIYLDTDEPETYENLESVFIEFNKNLIPFFITQSQLHKNDFLKVKFEEVNSENDADELIGNEVFLPLTMLPKLKGNKFYFHEVIGFAVHDKSKGFIGQIKSINDSASQALFEIDYNGIEILIPLIDQFIIKLDRTNKTIFLNTPAGLIDLYL